MEEWLKQQTAPLLKEVRAEVERGAKKGILIGGAVLLLANILLARLRTPACRCITSRDK